MKRLADKVAALQSQHDEAVQALREETTMRKYWTKRAETAESALKEIAECHECSGSQCRAIATTALKPSQQFGDVQP